MTSITYWLPPWPINHSAPTSRNWGARRYTSRQTEPERTPFTAWNTYFWEVSGVCISQTTYFTTVYDYDYRLHLTTDSYTQWRVLNLNCAKCQHYSTQSERTLQRLRSFNLSRKATTLHNILHSQLLTIHSSTPFIANLRSPTRVVTN